MIALLIGRLPQAEEESLAGQEIHLAWTFTTSEPRPGFSR